MLRRKLDPLVLDGLRNAKSREAAQMLRRRSLRRRRATARRMPRAEKQLKCFDMKSTYYELHLDGNAKSREAAQMLRRTTGIRRAVAAIMPRAEKQLKCFDGYDSSSKTFHT